MSATIIVYTGIPASGKTTVLDAALKVCPYVTVANYGEAMLKAAALKEVDRERLRKLPIHDQQEIGHKAAQHILAGAQGVVIIDTHALIKTPVGFIPGMPPKILDILKPHAFAVVEADPKVTYERRRKDHSRQRDNESIEEIHYHQEINRAVIASCCAACGAVYAPIDNGGTPAEAAAQLVRLIRFLHDELL